MEHIEFSTSCMHDSNVPMRRYSEIEKVEENEDFVFQKEPLKSCGNFMGGLVCLTGTFYWSTLF